MWRSYLCVILSTVPKNVLIRLDTALVSRMRIGMFDEILKAGGSPTIKLIIEWLKEKNESGLRDNIAKIQM
jgi:hypothetical protein